MTRTDSNLPTTTESLDLVLDDDTTVDAILARPSGEGTWPGCWCGWTRSACGPAWRRWPRTSRPTGYVVLVPNLYHRAVPSTPLRRDLMTDEGRSTAFKGSGR